MKVLRLCSSVALAALTLTTTAMAADPLEQSPPFRAMNDELARTKNLLRLEDKPRPYFASYTMHDIDQFSAVASFGSLLTSGGYKTRLMRGDVRVGDYEVDSSNT